MKKFFEEFKAFAIRGNAFNLAVGVIIGNGFTAIINSLVNDIIMPFFAVLTGDITFSQLSIVLNPNSGSTITWNYGNFIQNLVNFFIIAFTVFCTIKLSNRILHKKEDKEETKEPVLSDETKALREIIEILKSEKASDLTNK